MSGDKGVNVLTDFVCHKGTLPLQVKGCKIMNFAQPITSAVEHGCMGLYRAIPARTQVLGLHGLIQRNSQFFRLLIPEDLL